MPGYSGLDCYFSGLGREKSLICLRERGWDIKRVILPLNLAEPLRNSRTIFERQGFEVILAKRDDLPRVAAAARADILLSIGFHYILPEQVIKCYKLALNSHPTLLPKYRGPTSGAYILLNAETESGLTVHLIDAGMDTGPIVLQKKFPISPFDTTRSVQNKSYALEPEALAEALQLSQTEGFTPRPQDESRALTYPRKRTPEDSEIDPHKSILALYDAIRACDPEKYPAFFYWRGQKVCLKLWRPDKQGDDPSSL